MVFRITTLEINREGKEKKKKKEKKRKKKIERRKSLRLESVGAAVVDAGMRDSPQFGYYSGFFLVESKVN